MSSETTKTGNAGLVKIAPVMFAFFVMGFVDLVGTATNYVKAEFGLADGTANLFTTMVFFWFLIFSVPTGILMNKIGRRKTVLWSILVTLVAMALPIIAYLLCPMKSTVQLVLIVISFAFLGIGNTLMQVSLNPLLTVFVKGDKLASTLTLGQFVKAFASLFAPWIAMWGANSISAFTYTNADGKQVGMWWILFVIYFIVGILGYVLLAFDKIEEPAPDAGTTTIGRCFKLLFSDRIVLLCFLGIVAHVGVDVAINAQAPRILTEHTGDTFTAIASSATMVYFVARMIGCFTGGIVLQKISNKLGVRICGVACLQMPMTAYASKQLSGDDVAQGTAIITSIRQISSALLSSVLIGIMALASSGDLGIDAHGFGVAFSILAALTIAGFVFGAVFLPKRRKASGRR